MSISEINLSLTKLYYWYTNQVFDGIQEEEKHEIITNKMIELKIFDIDFKDMDFFNKSELTPEASEISYLLNHLFCESVSKSEKMNLLLNNPNN